MKLVLLKLDNPHITTRKNVFRKNRPRNHKLYSHFMVYQLQDAVYYMSRETRDYFVKKLNGKLYHFCKIRFYDGGKLYAYVAQDRSVSVGDTISIPTGNGEVPESAIVQVVDAYDDSLDNLPFPLELLRCVERKLKSIQCPNCGQNIQVCKGKDDNKMGKCEFCGTQFYFL